MFETTKGHTLDPKKRERHIVLQRLATARAHTWEKINHPSCCRQLYKQLCQIQPLPSHQPLHYFNETHAPEYHSSRNVFDCR